MTYADDVCKLLARAMAWAAEARDTMCLLVVEVRSADGGSTIEGSLPAEAVLSAMGERLGSASGPLDTVMRMGVDRFAVILAPTGDATRSGHVADKLLKVVGESPHLTARIGAACSTAALSEPSRLLQRAESALRQAKDAGKTLLFAGSPPSPRRASVAIPQP